VSKPSPINLESIFVEKSKINTIYIIKIQFNDKNNDFNHFLVFSNTGVVGIWKLLYIAIESK